MYQYIRSNSTKKDKENSFILILASLKESCSRRIRTNSFCALHLLSEAKEFFGTSEKIVAKIGLQICFWDGLAWVPLIGDTPELRDGMVYVSDTEIYAVVGNKICVWDGTTWSLVGSEIPGLTTAFAINDGFIYAVIGNQVCKIPA